jgi:polyhydroxyalkanoate depolymerase
MPEQPVQDAHRYPEIGVPLFWPLGLPMAGLALAERTAAFLAEVQKTQVERAPPQWSTPNGTLLELRTLTLREFAVRLDAAPVLVLPPYAGHSSTIADFAPEQSLVATLLDNGCGRVLVTDWHGATPAMRDYDIDNYLAEINVAVDEIGAPVALVGLCQGGWAAAMYAARFPAKVRRLVLAGAPIDTDAGDGAIKAATHELPMSFYEQLVALGGGRLMGAFMLEGFKNLHPDRQYVAKFAELYEHVDDAAYVARFERFERWYEYTLDLPGAWYLQAVRELFKENRLAKGEFVALGRRIDLRAIRCPLYLLAGRRDDITPPAQVFNAARLVGTPPAEIEQALAEGGHIGLYMGRDALRQVWPPIARWLAGAATANPAAPSRVGSPA